MRIEYVETESKLCTIRAHYSVGSAIEYRSKVWNDGLAHLVEHMIYRQNEYLHDKLGLIGASWNGGTYYNDVMFIATVPVENVYELLHIFKKLLLDNKFTQEKLDKERLVILEEENLTRYDLSRNIALERNRFMCNGYITKRISGSSESINKITLKEVQSFYDKYFTLDNLLLVVSGPSFYFNIEELFGKKNDLFVEQEIPSNIFKDKVKQTKYFSQLQSNARIFVTYSCEPSWSRQNIILNLISGFFSSGIDTRLFKELRNEKGLVYSANSGISLLSDIGWYNFIAVTQKQNIKAVLETINTEIIKLKTDDITDKEITKAKNKELGYLYSLTETSYGLNSLLTSQIINGTPDIKGLEDLIKTITKNEIVKTIEDIFVEDNQRIFIASPKDK